jgi:dihydrofolate synthase/folylpolyglutamate synthase
MNYTETVEYIHSINRFAKKLGLENIRNLMRELGNPQDGLRFVHIAGTNGKGSTAAMVASVMRAAGYRTGLYTSPYLQRFTERIRVDGAEIPEGDLVRHAETVRAAIAKIVADGYAHPTELEVVAAIAFLHFASEGCDIVAFEVGLGGRFDPTNVINTPLAAVVTTIDYDHVARLGGTLEEIANQKAGIIKTGGDVVIYEQTDGVRRVFEDAAAEVGARLTVCDFSTVRQESYGTGGQRFAYGRRDGIEIGLLGDYQMRNASLVIETVDAINRNAGCGIHVPEEALRRGLKAAQWPGRMEILRENPAVLIDAAHNAQCARALRDALVKYFPDMELIFVMGVLRDKDYLSIIDSTLPLASAVFTAAPESARAIPADELAGILRERGGERLAGRVWPCASAVEAMRRAAEYAGEKSDKMVYASPPEKMVCAFGSLYLVGGIRDIYKPLA